MGKALLVAVPGNVTNNNWLAPAGGTYSTVSPEAPTAFLTRIAGDFTLLAVKVNATGTARSYRFRKNSTNGNLVVSPADAASGVFVDSTHTDSLTAGDYFDVQFAHTGSAPTVNFIRAVFTATTNHACFYQCAGPTSIFVAAGTYYIAPTGRGDGSGTTEADQKLRIRAGGSAKNLNVYCGFNTETGGTMVVRSRVNGANGNLSVTITNGVTGRYEDSTHSDTLASGDDFCLQWAHAGTGGNCGIGPVGVAIENASASKNDLFAGCDSNLGISRSASASATFYRFTGSIIGGSTTEADQTVQHGFSVTATRLRARLKSNSYSASATLKSRKNGADGSLSVTITAGVAGVYEDTTNSDSVAATDDYCAAIVGGTSGSIAIMWVGITEEDAGSGPVNYPVSVAASTTPPASVRRGGTHGLTAATTPPATARRGAAHTVSSSTTPPATARRGAAHPLSASTTPPATVAAQRGYLSALAALTSPIASIRRAIARLLAGVTTPTTRLQFGVGKSLGATTSPSSALGRSAGAFLRAVTAPPALLSESQGTFPALVSTTPYGADGATLQTIAVFAALDLSDCDVAMVEIFVLGSLGSLVPGALSTLSPGWLAGPTTITDTFTWSSRVFYKFAPTASETLTVNWSNASATAASWAARLIRLDRATVLVMAGSTDNDPAPVDTLSTHNLLVIATGGARVSNPYTAGPSGYGGFDWTAVGPTVGNGFAYTLVSAQIEDPGAFTGGGASRRECWTIAAYAGSSYSQPLDNSTILIASLSRFAGKPLGVSTTAPATLRRPAGKPLGVSTTPPAAFLRGTGKPLAVTTAPAATLRRGAGKSLTISTTPLAALRKAAPRLLNAATTPIAALVRGAGLFFSVRGAFPFNNGSQTFFSAGLSIRAGYFRTLLAAALAQALLVRGVARRLDALTTPLARLIRSGGRPLAASTTPQPLAQRDAGKPVAASTSPLAIAIRGPLVPLASTTTPLATVRASFNKLLDALTAPIASLLARLFHLPEACRIIDVATEDRTVTVAAEDRTVTIAAEDRTIFVDSCEPKLYAFPARYTPEAKGYAADWSRRLADGHIITLATVSVMEGDLVVSDVDWSDTAVTFRLTGGSPVYQRLAIRVTVDTTPEDIQQIEATIACYS